MDNSYPSFYSIIPAHVRYCKDLEPNAKLLYGEITALCNQQGYCCAINQYFADIFKVDRRTISRWLKSLKDQKFIFINTKKIEMQWDRKISISAYEEVS